MGLCVYVPRIYVLVLFFPFPSPFPSLSLSLSIALSLSQPPTRTVNLIIFPEALQLLDQPLAIVSSLPLFSRISLLSRIYLSHLPPLPSFSSRSSLSLPRFCPLVYKSLLS